MRPHPRPCLSQIAWLLCLAPGALWAKAPAGDIASRMQAIEAREAALPVESAAGEAAEASPHDESSVAHAAEAHPFAAAATPHSKGAHGPAAEEEKVLRPLQPKDLEIRWSPKSDDPKARWKDDFRRASTVLRQRDYPRAESLLLRVLGQAPGPEEERLALLQISELYRMEQNTAKRAAVLERFIERFPQDPEAPRINLDLGRTYRELGAANMAISRFYNVLNSFLKIGDAQQAEYLQIALQAKLEIAETHFEKGNYGEAVKFYTRLRPLDFEAPTQARIVFKKAYAQALLEQPDKVLVSLQGFAENYPGSELIPEALFLRANAYKKLGRSEEAVQEVLRLLTFTQSTAQQDAANWLYWKKRTGNQLANEFYEQGDFRSALRIYQTLATLSPDAEWRWPLVYQIGLCLEKMHLTPKAADTYRALMRAMEDNDAYAQVSESVQVLRDMARWRLSQLEWDTDVNTRMEALLPPIPAS